MSRDHAGVRSQRALLGAIDDALRMLGRRVPLPDAAVHGGRKAIKKARAALRLVREGLAEPVYRKENAALRDAGRFLAPLRDAKSLQATFSTLRARYPARFRQMQFAALARHLREQRLAVRRHMFGSTAKLRACVRALRACRTRLGRWRPIDAAAIAAGLKRIYRSGRRELARAQRAGTPQALHEWRKQVKYLANALNALEVSDKHLAKTATRAAQLADILGDDHDLAELARHVGNETRSGIGAADAADLSALTESQRRKLKARAFALGARIYAEKPRHFAARLAAS